MPVRLTFKPFALVATLLLLMLFAPVIGAQEGEEKPLLAYKPSLKISGVDSSRAPWIDVVVLGRDENGQAVNFNDFDDIDIQHNGDSLTDFEIADAQTIGTFTVFLIDLPGGVVNELDAIEGAIQSYLAEPTMVEKVDFVAVYQVGATGAEALGAPSEFYNGVKNIFGTTPLVTTLEATALYDSMVNLIQTIPKLRPEPNMAMSLVVLSDGTDAISEAQPEQVVSLAQSSGIAIHTISVPNLNLGAGGQEVGAAFLQETAAATGGSFAFLGNNDGINNIWQRVAAFRDHTVLRYRVETLEPGSFSVEVGLRNNPDYDRVESEGELRPETASVIIPLPENEDLVIRVPDLDTPLKIRLPVEISWLDGEDRTLSTVNLRVNNATIYPLPAEKSFVADIEVLNFNYGPNKLEILITDSDGVEGGSQSVILEIGEGEKSIPKVFRPASSWVRTLLWLVLFVALAAAVYYIIRAILGWMSKSKQKVAAGAKPSATKPATRTAAPRGQTKPSSTQPETIQPYAEAVTPTRPSHAYLEILDARTTHAPSAPIDRAEFLIGRSPNVDLSLADDLTVSRVHATIVRDGDNYRIYDEQSTSGTFVNDRQVQEYGLLLNDGDEIYLGAVHFRFRRS